jgi:uncharacterized protein YbjQ (UPF0145 family)
MTISTKASQENLPEELATIVTTTNSIEGRRILSDHGVVTGQTIMGVDLDDGALGSGEQMLMVPRSGTAVSIA